MALPAAPQELDGGKLLFLMWDNTGVNAAAILRALSHRLQNGEQVASLAVATHEDGDTFAANDPVALMAGVEGTTVRKMLVDQFGRPIMRPPLVYNSAGSNAFALQKVLKQETLNSEAVGHAAVATHVDGETFDSGDPLVVLGGVATGVAKPLALDGSNRVLMVPDTALGGTGHVNVAVTGTAVQMKSSTACRKVRVKADPGNAATLYVGISSVTANETAGTGGLQLAPGDETDIEVANVSTLYINGQSSEGASFMWWT